MEGIVLELPSRSKSMSEEEPCDLRAQQGLPLQVYKGFSEKCSAGNSQVKVSYYAEEGQELLLGGWCWVLGTQAHMVWRYG